MPVERPRERPRIRMSTGSSYSKDRVSLWDPEVELPLISAGVEILAFRVGAGGELSEQASRFVRHISTFSCAIGYSDSPMASRASTGSGYMVMWVIWVPRSS
jgi:hypothetical protein